MLKTFDLFGREFNFRIDKKTKFKTSFGGIMSIISLCVCVLISFILGRYFYFRTNPKVMKQSGFFPNQKKHHIANQNFSIAWRIEDAYSNEIDFKGLIFPQLNYYFYQLNKTTNNYASVLKEKIALNVT